MSLALSRAASNIAPPQLFANVLKLHVVKLDYPALARAMGGSKHPLPHPRSLVRI